MDSMPEFLQSVDARMKELIELDLPITKSSLNTDDAVSLFRVRRMYDKERLFKYRRVSKVNIYGIDGFEDYYYGYMLPSTGYIKYYELIPYEDGFQRLLRRFLRLFRRRSFLMYLVRRRNLERDSTLRPLQI